MRKIFLFLMVFLAYFVMADTPDVPVPPADSIPVLVVPGGGAAVAYAPVLIGPVQSLTPQEIAAAATSLAVGGPIVVLLLFALIVLLILFSIKISNAFEEIKLEIRDSTSELRRGLYTVRLDGLDVIDNTVVEAASTKPPEAPSPAPTETPKDEAPSPAPGGGAARSSGAGGWS
jgi:hypothetical protein